MKYVQLAYTAANWNLCRKLLCIQSNWIYWKIQNRIHPVWNTWAKNQQAFYVRLESIFIYLRLGSGQNTATTTESSQHNFTSGIIPNKYVSIHPMCKLFIHFGECESPHAKHYNHWIFDMANIRAVCWTLFVRIETIQQMKIYGSSFVNFSDWREK